MHAEQFALHPSFVDHVTDRKTRSVRERVQNAGPSAYVTNAAGDRLAVNSSDVRRQSKAVAVLPLWGVLAQHSSWYADTSTDQFVQDFRKLDNNAAVGTIIILTNSPGGSVPGVQEASDSIFAARRRNQTRIIQAISSLSASAAEWIGSACHERVIQPSGECGSIGVISIYLSASKALDQDGYEATVVRTPANKARFSGLEDATPEMVATMQERNQQAYSRFVSGVARNRGVTTSTVMDNYGNGETMTAQQAMSVGYVDAIATVDEVVSDAVSGRRTPVTRRAATASSSASAARWRKLRLIEAEL